MEVNLWYALNIKTNKIDYINNLDKNNKKEKRVCPICSGEVIPKMGNKMSWHFAHKNGETCNSESMIHWWFKNELIKTGDEFTVITGNKENIFKCKQVDIEKQYNTSYGIYKPDLTVVTEDNKLIHFEIANTNKKKIKDYINKWKELGNIVVELEIKDIINKNKINKVIAKYYNGKELVDIEKDFRNTINKELKKGLYDENVFNENIWLINDICKYFKNEISIEELSYEIYSIKDLKTKELISKILKNDKCNNILNNYIYYMINKFIKNNENILNKKDIYFTTNNARLINDRIFYGFKLCINYNHKKIFDNTIGYDENLLSVNQIKGLNNYLLVKEYASNNLNINNISYYNSDLYDGYGHVIFLEEEIPLNIDIDTIIKILNVSIENNKNKLLFQRKVENVIDNIKGDIKDLSFDDYNRIYFTYGYKCNNIIKNYKMSFEYKDYFCDEEYIKIKFLECIKQKFIESICYLLKEFKKVHCFCSNIRKTQVLYIDYNCNSIPFEIEFEESENYFNLIIALYNKYLNRIKKLDEYKDLFYDYYLKCKNTKNNYHITLLDNACDIYYDENKIESINYLFIDNIYEVLSTNKNLKLSIIEDLEDYNNKLKLNNIIKSINKRYNDLNITWSVILDYYNGVIKLENLENKYYFIDFNIKDLNIKDEENILFSYLINIMSDYIRKYKYNLED